MDGNTKSGYISYRKENSFKLISEANLIRLQNLTMQKICRHLADFVYKNASLLVVHRELVSPPALTECNLEVECQLIDVNYKKQINRLSNLAVERIEEFFRNGAKCLGVFYQSELIAYSWCHYIDHYFPFFNYYIDVTDGVYIGPDFVSADYRGNRIHGYVLTRMFAMLYEDGYRYVLGSVLHNNYASVKGLKSVGFTPKQRIKTVKILKKPVYKTIHMIENW